MSLSKMRTVALITACIFVLTSFAVPVLAGTADDNEITGTTIVGDVLFARPLGLLATVLGTTVFILSIPFNPNQDKQKLAVGKLIEEPAAYTFKRPLGQF